jgi:oligoribonuclease
VAANRIWADLETSGLDARNGHIFELAIVVTTADSEYRELAAQSWVVGWDVDDQWLRARLDPYVYEMHTRNNLLHEIPFGQPLAEVEEQACRLVQFFGNPAPGREPIAGSSVHFDRSWLEIHMPRLMRQFSHRCLMPPPSPSSPGTWAWSCHAASPRTEPWPTFARPCS